ncbi:MAG TPA: A24 family peptidase [Gammaproteobacteria bacterium]|nr:A24 family peptidase [Gammaproteobacteria bacterium]
MDIFEVWPPALIVASLAIGLVVGSFLNVVAFRLPLMMQRAWRAEAAEAHGAPPVEEERFDLVSPRSRCPHCRHPIPASRNVPILSYLLLKGRCGHCRAAISPRYPIVEALTGILSVVVAIRFGATWATPAALVLTWYLIALSLIDLDHKLLPDSMTLPLLWIGIILTLVRIDGAPVFAGPDLRSSVIGAAAGYLSLWSVYQIFKLVTGKEGMGYGDFKLLAALGAWLGWQLLPLVIVLSAAVGSIVGLSLILTGQRSRQAEIPFGPYLAGAGWLALLFGRDIMSWYLSLTG